MLILILLSNSMAFYDMNLANIGVWLSGVAYCNKEKYMSINFTGPATGFNVTHILYNITTDLQGYIGFMKFTKTIHIVLRGSYSILNWLDNFKIKRVLYTSWTECNCSVHYGFYKSALSIANETIYYVSELLLKYPKFSVIINGHSYGAACGDILSMELLKAGIVSKYYGYGKPRVGDINYSIFLNSKISEHYRHTHDRDIVPHLPPTLEMGYYHSCQEIFEDKFNNITICSKYEDITCGNQYKLTQTNIYHHLYYLQHYLSCEDSIL